MSTIGDVSGVLINRGLHRRAIRQAGIAERHAISRNMLTIGSIQAGRAALALSALLG